MRCRYAITPDSGESVLDAIDPFIDLSEVGGQIAYSNELQGLLEQIYGEPAILFKDKYILRASKAPGYPPHQDFISWPFFPKSFTTVLVALDSISAENGGLSFYKGSHKLGLLTPADGDFHNISRAKFEGFEKVTFAMNPGDVVIFNAFIIHESEANHSGRPRRSMYLSYNAMSDGGDQRQSHYRFFHTWLRKRFGEYGDERLYFR
jgi:ectoine hydroxylase-related dioxygenase (phytanoyl-CoA dioxygenase family)